MSWPIHPSSLSLPFSQIKPTHTYIRPLTITIITKSFSFFMLNLVLLPSLSSFTIIDLTIILTSFVFFTS